MILLLSIVIPVYNESEQRVLATLSSCSNSYKDEVEYIIVDSSEVTVFHAVHVACTVGISSNLVKIIKSHPTGIYSACNLGVQAANGRFIAFMNVGDSYCKDAINLFLEFQKAYHGLLSRPIIFFGGSILVNRFSQHLLTHQLASPRTLLRKLTITDLVFYPPCHQAIFAESSLFRKRLPFDHEFFPVCADRKFMLEAYRSGAAFIRLPFDVCLYEIGGYSFRNSIQLLDDIYSLSCLYLSLPFRVIAFCMILKYRLASNVRRLVHSIFYVSD